MGAAEKKKQKKIPVVYRTHTALSLLQNGFLSWIAFAEVSKSGVHLTWLLCLCPVSLSDSTFRGVYSVTSLLSSFTTYEGHWTSEILVLALFVAQFPLCHLSHLRFIRSVSGVLARRVIYSSPSHWPQCGVHGLKSGLNLWMFCSSRPVCLWDKTGATWGGLQSPFVSREGRKEGRKHFQEPDILVERTSPALQCWQPGWPSLPSGAGLWSPLQCCSLANLAVSPFLSPPKLPSPTSARGTSGQCTVGWSGRRTCARTCGGTSAAARPAETFMQTRCSRRVNEPVPLLRAFQLFGWKSRTSRSEYWNFTSCYSVVDPKAHLMRLETNPTDWIPKSSAHPPWKKHTERVISRSQSFLSILTSSHFSLMLF